MKHGQSATAFPHDWIRPWYPAGKTGHIKPDCPDLLRWVPEPVEGPGWLDPEGDRVCTSCYQPAEVPSWDAECDTCGARMSEQDEYYEPPSDEKTARDWKFDHKCEPDVRLIPPTPKDAAA